MYYIYIHISLPYTLWFSGMLLSLYLTINIMQPSAAPYDPPPFLFTLA